MKGNFARPPTLKKGGFYDKKSPKYEIYVGSDYETCGSELGIDADFFCVDIICGNMLIRQGSIMSVAKRNYVMYFS